MPRSAQRGQRRKTMLRTLSSTLLAAVALMACGQTRAQDPVQNVTGSYKGVAVFGDGSVRPVAVPYLTQDNLRTFSGELRLDLISVPVKGSIAANGQCMIVGSSDDGRVVLHLRWHKFGGGAAALTGSVQQDTPAGKQTGTIALFRPFTPDGKPRPAISGDYGGTFRVADTGAQGEIRVGIRDGT